MGPFEVIGGRRLDIPGSKRQALLAMLALAAGRVVTVDDVIDALWGPTSRCSAKRRQHHVTRLRAALAAMPLPGCDGYALHHATVDALAFELLVAAVTARRDGDPRAAAADSSAALILARAAFRSHRCTLVRCRGAAARRASPRCPGGAVRCGAGVGEHREVAAEVRAALNENPYRERLWGS